MLWSEDLVFWRAIENSNELKTQPSAKGGQFFHSFIRPLAHGNSIHFHVTHATWRVAEIRASGQSFYITTNNYHYHCEYVYKLAGSRRNDDCACRWLWLAVRILLAPEFVGRSV